MNNICVYLGANPGHTIVYQHACIALGHALVDKGYTLVYGGSSLGTMGCLASTVKQSGGKVIGVITKHLLDKECPPDNLDALHVVDSMQERKKLLLTLGDAFVVMPGGLGTLEEAIETWNAIKIGEINKKIGFLNIENYYKKLFDFMDHVSAQGFFDVQPSCAPIISHNPHVLLNEIIKNKGNDSPHI